MAVGSVVQLLGALLVVAGLAWLFGPWVLVAGGCVLVVAPEVGVVVAGLVRRPAGGERQ